MVLGRSSVASKDLAHRSLVHSHHNAVNFVGCIHQAAPVRFCLNSALRSVQPVVLDVCNSVDLSHNCLDCDYTEEVRHNYNSAWALLVVDEMWYLP